MYGKTLDELRERTEKVKSALKTNNLTLNVGKCEYDKQEMKFLGHTVSASGF